MIYHNNTCTDPFDFIKSIKKRYKKGLSLIAPDQTSRILSAEDLLNMDIDLGECENPLVLALVAARDPMVTMSMAATARFTPLTHQHKLMSGIFTIVGDISKHKEVKDCVYVVVKENFHKNSFLSLRSHVVKEIHLKRKHYRQQILNNLQNLIDGKIHSTQFISHFFEGMNQLNLKTPAYTKMVTDFVLSKKFRPKVKILMLENLYKMPRDVRMQVMMHLINAPMEGHNIAIRDELICILQDDPQLLAEPANVNQHVSFLRPYPRTTHQKNKDFEDPALKTAERIFG